jgi:pantoate--beta-alanine ligase
MGALHEGHLSLVETARKQNDVVAVSIFVNPTQFGPNEDFDKYPRQFDDDFKLLSKYGVDHILAPTNSQEMYNPNHVTSVHLDGFDDLPEGKLRPGHFDGVATVVTKLFNIVKPTRAYFGQKDAVQCVLIQRLVEDLNMDVDVCVMDTVREHDGLAKSSRNAYLSSEERAAASIIYKSLLGAQELFNQHKEQQRQQGSEQHSSKATSLSSSDIIAAVRNILETEPLVSEIQYVSVDDRRTMRPTKDVAVLGTSPSSSSVGAVVSLACKVGSVRLIDNIVLK